VSGRATAVSHPNIAFIKYWGNRDHPLRLASNGSISLTLAGLETRTTVYFDPTATADQLVINGQAAPEAARRRASEVLDLVRQLSGLAEPARVESESDFPAGAGLASSASAFAALATAACAAASLQLEPQDLSRIARRGSGSAGRSIFGGYVEAHTGRSDLNGYAQQIAPPEHWALVDWVVVVQPEAKQVGSSQGHQLADTSPLQAARVADAPRRLERCRRAILERDFGALAGIVELDSNLMHAVMLTSAPPLLYWRPETVALMRAIAEWRREGLAACYTIDAGPNLHCLCPAEMAEEVGRRLTAACPEARLIRAWPGGPTRLVEA
jgi:diphosphomevalonate decarboxylase